MPLHEIIILLGGFFAILLGVLYLLFPSSTDIEEEEHATVAAETSEELEEEMLQSRHTKTHEEVEEEAYSYTRE